MTTIRLMSIEVMMMAMILSIAVRMVNNDYYDDNDEDENLRNSPKPRRILKTLVFAIPFRSDIFITIFKLFMIQILLFWPLQ